MRRLDFSVSGAGDGDPELRRREQRGTTYTLLAVLASLVVLGRGHVDVPPTAVTSAVTTTASVVHDPRAVAELKSVPPDSKPDTKPDAKKESVVPPAVILSIAPDPIEFGEQTVDSASAPVSVTIRNDGSSTVTLPQVGAMDRQSESFKVVGMCDRRELAVGETCVDEVTFIPSVVGEQRATFVIADENYNRLAIATLHGTGRGIATVETDPAALAFEEFSLDRQRLTVSNGGATTLVIHGVSIRGSDGDDRRFSVASDTCKGETIAPGARCAVDIAVRPRDPDLGLDAELVLTHSAPGPEFAVPLNWRAAPQATLRLEPASIGFGTLDVAQSSSRQATMTNTGVAPTRIGDPRFDARDAGTQFRASTDCGAQLSPGSSCSLTVVANPAGPGAFNTTVYIFDSHGRPLADAGVSLDARQLQTMDGPAVR